MIRWRRRKKSLTSISLFHSVAGGERVIFDARVDTVRKSSQTGAIILVLRDEGHFVTAILNPNTTDEKLLQRAQECTVESIVRVAGVVRPRELAYFERGSGNAPLDTIQVTELNVLATALHSLPVGVSQGGAEKKEERACERVAVGAFGLNERLNNRVLDVRAAAVGAIFKLHAGICELIVEYMSANDFHWIHTPRIVGTTIEGDNEFFSLPYFGKQAWLAQTSEFHQQMAIAMDMKRVFEIGPLFRAEGRISSRHLTEFTGLDFVMTFKDHYHELIDFTESLIVFIICGLQERDKYKSFTDLAKRLHSSAGTFKLGLDGRGKVPRITFTEAKRLLQEQAGIQTNELENLSADEEAALGRFFRTSSFYGETDVFIIDGFPAHLRPFYSQRSAFSPDFANAFDVILRGREVASASQNINSYAALRKAMQTRCPPLDPDAEQWKAYLDAFKAGVAPHGGCGIGINRLLQGYLGLENVREATLFPRDAMRLFP